MPSSTTRPGRPVPHTPALEPLEPKVMLSGNIMALVVDGNLLVWGDAQDNHVAVDQVGLSASQVRVGQFDGTTNGGLGSVVLDGVTGNVVVSLDDGNDTLAVGSPDGSMRVRGNLVVHTKSNSGIWGDPFTELDNQLFLANVQIDGNLSVAGPFRWIGLGAQADTSVAAYQDLPIDTIIRGNFTARTGLLSSVAMTAACVDGSVTVTGGHACNVSINGGSVVGGNFTLAADGAAGANIYEALIGGRVNVHGGNEGGGVTADLATIRGDADLRFNEGEVAIDLCVADIGGDLRINPGRGPSHITLGFIEEMNEAGPLIGGGLYINTAASVLDQVELLCTGVRGDVVLVDGDGPYEAQIEDCTFGSNLLFRKSAGYGGLAITMAWVNQNAIIHQDCADLDVSLSSVTVAGDLMLKGRGTTDTNLWNLEYTDVYGALRACTGGRDSEIMQTFSDVSVGGNATFINHSPYGSVVTSEFDVKGDGRIVNRHAGHLYLDLNGTIDRNLLMQLGCRGGWISTEALDVSGDLRLLSSGQWEGEIALGGTVKGSLLGRLGGQDAYLDMTRCCIAGDARLRLAYRTAVNARLGMEELGGNLTVASVGASDDTIDMGGLAAAGAIMLRTGRGADDVRTDGAGVGWGTWIDTGDGDDAVACCADLLLAGAAVRTGAGKDTVTCAARDWDGGGGMVRGFGTLAVNVGDGDDEIIVNILDEVADPIALSNLLFAGGRGRDSMRWTQPNGGGFGGDTPEGPSFWGIEEMIAEPVVP
ncbi:MAG: LEPR-XLL domain-containing protein [Planctomycetes bacterium]|nr:LEPR-XLL domain-containing protein [Planctomycetota bacterium]